jgi:hypothetical protein
VVAVGLALMLILVREFLAQLAVADPAKHRALIAIWESLRPGRSPRRT